MTSVSEFLVEKNEGLIRWNLRKTPISIALRNIDQAMLDKINNTVFVLTGVNELPTYLHIYSSDGVEIMRTMAPVGFQFYYLSEYPKQGVSIVCVADNPVDGWRDWHFGFDFQKKELFRINPAY